VLRSTAGHPRESYIKRAYVEHRLIIKYQITGKIHHLRNVYGYGYKTNASVWFND